MINWILVRILMKTPALGRATCTAANRTSFKIDTSRSTMMRKTYHQLIVKHGILVLVFVLFAILMIKLLLREQWSLRISQFLLILAKTWKQKAFVTILILLVGLDDKRTRAKKGMMIDGILCKVRISQHSHQVLCILYEGRNRLLFTCLPDKAYLRVLLSSLELKGLTLF